MKNLSIYVHYPFCKSKCPYCDFNSHIKKEGINDENLINAYQKEISYFSSLINKKTRVNSIFFGGGTPSLMNINLCDKILGIINKHFSLEKNCEITLEANPTSFETKKFKDFKKIGINRISLGIQSLNNQDLKFLGRNHDANDGINAIKEISKIFDNYSFDLIYARPSQTLNSWKNELNQAINIAGPHLSLYQLTIEKGTKFYKQYKNKEFHLPNDELSENLYNLTNDILDKNGLFLYEVSNFAKKEYECKHNLNYWNSGNYLGIGAGAHGRINIDGVKYETINHYNPEKWITSIKNNENAIWKMNKLSSKEVIEEIILMGLRLKTGISKNNLVKLKLLENIKYDKIKFLIENKFLILEKNRIYITNKGRILTNSIIEKVISAVN